MSYDITKVANAIILALNCGVKYLGKTKLMKLLFFADKEHLKRYGRPIFFDVYVKKPKGPVPLHTYSILSSYNDCEQADFHDELKTLFEWLEIEEKDVGQPSPMMSFKEKKNFDPEIFSPSELKVLREVFEAFKEDTAEQISEKSHCLPEYQTANMGEVIPYEEMAEDMADYVRMWEEEKKAFLHAIS